MSDQKCCLCLPLECGIKTLAVFTIIGTVLNGVWLGFFEEDGLSFFWPFLACEAIMSIVWIVALINPGEQGETRKFALLTWIVLMLAASFIYYLVIILNGSMVDRYCTQDAVQEINDAYAEMGINETMTVEDCTSSTKTWLWVDFVIKLLFTTYFTYEIKNWSQHEEGYQKA